MPVQAADIVQIAMDIGDEASTGCEQTGLRSDMRVSKRAERTNEAVVSNQIHIVKEALERKAWKSGWPLHISLVETHR
jgi:hypothetical protein